jgi:ribosomal protein L37AE/L43A
VPNTDRVLPIQCPKCQYGGSTLVARGLTIITLKCISCAYTWAMQFDSLSPDIQEQILAEVPTLLPPEAQAAAHVCPTCLRSNTTKCVESLLTEIHICRDCHQTFVIDKSPSPRITLM